MGPPPQRLGLVGTNGMRFILALRWTPSLYLGPCPSALNLISDNISVGLWGDDGVRRAANGPLCNRVSAHADRPGTVVARRCSAARGLKRDFFGSLSLRLWRVIKKRAL